MNRLRDRARQVKIGYRKAESWVDRALHWLAAQDYTAIIVAITGAVFIVWLLKF